MHLAEDIGCAGRVLATRCLVEKTLVERGRAVGSRSAMIKPASFKNFETGPEIIRLAVMLYIRCPFSLRNIEDLLQERGDRSQP